MSKKLFISLLALIFIGFGVFISQKEELACHFLTPGENPVFDGEKLETEFVAAQNLCQVLAENSCGRGVEDFQTLSQKYKYIGHPQKALKTYLQMGQCFPEVFLEKKGRSNFSYKTSLISYYDAAGDTRGAAAEIVDLLFQYKHTELLDVINMERYENWLQKLKK
ncbi:hypothetical protein COB57_01290 [Candidatus Peregrinibacteria bacterium]|nr:MAG: hypothetical protein COB57_01290 [Candidatus Peregrinibacteria bacterium]